jgi:ribose transport system ATP-binding protein
MTPIAERDESVRAPAIETRALSKTLGGRRVLNEVDLEVGAGEIHALVGHNGSGKSTLIKILSGYHSPDPGGSLRVAGSEVGLPLHSAECHRLGLAFVHQDLGLVDEMTVVESLRVGRYDCRFGWRIDWRGERRRARETLAPYGLDVDPETPVGELREVERALLAIARAVEQVRDASQGLLVLDEPTAYLPADGVELLFEAMRRTAEMGLGLLFVTHRLEEVMRISDRVTILRDGRKIETAPTAGFTEDSLVETMLGRGLERFYPRHHDPGRETSVRIRDLSGERVEGLSADLRQGEILGLTGLLGMGWEEVPYLLFGAHSATSGTISFADGRQRDLSHASPSRSISDGVILLPVNRQRDSGSPVATAAENMTLPTVGKYVSLAVLRRKAERARVAGLMSEFGVQPPQPQRQFGTFSGGNQQKVLVAKWLECDPSLLLLHEPVSGVDVGSKHDIFVRIRAAADAGRTVVVASADSEDLAHLCDRVMIFRDGRLSSELQGSELTNERIVEHSYRRVAGGPGAAPC